MEDLIKFLIEFGGDNGFDIVVNANDGDKDLDFININLKTKKIYFGELSVEDELTEVG